MKEENNTPKNKWSRMFRKKWFFPALYLTLAALLLTTVIWYQSSDDQADTEDAEDVEDYTDSPYDEDAEPVASQQEVIKMPVEDADQAEIVTTFFDYNADEEEQESALVHYNNRYYQSTGIDVAPKDDEDMNVTAALSGTVKDVKEDPLLGNLIEVTHKDDVETYYASLDEVKAETGDEIEQGDTLGTAGKNILGQDNGEHVHFELRKDGDPMDPEEFFDQPVSKLKSVESDEEEEEAAESNADESEETDEQKADDEADEADEADEDAGESESEEEDDPMEDSDQPGIGDNDEGDSDMPDMDEDDEKESDEENSDEDIPGLDNDSEGLGDLEGSTP